MSASDSARSAGSAQPKESRARRRILDTASALFYAEGVHAVGIDRIIAEAPVAKATFYNYFPSKDDLVLAYVQEQDETGRSAAAQLPTQPRQALQAFFDRYATAAREPSYRGCPFINAAAEYPDPASPVRRAIDDHRRWLRDLFHRLLVADGHPDPDTTADILMLLADGILVAGELDDPTPLRTLGREALTHILGS
jgi:AcrR family transcriptional regulator